MQSVLLLSVRTQLGHFEIPRFLSELSASTLAVFPVLMVVWGSSPCAAGCDGRACEEVLHGQRGALAGSKTLQGGRVGRTRPGVEPAAGGVLHRAKLRLGKA